jgi:hypothetical protein
MNNTIIKVPKNNNIIHYQNLALLTVSSLSLFVCMYCKITNKFDGLYYLIPIICFYAFVDLFYTKKIDSKLHHIFILGLVFYFKSVVVDDMNTNILVYSFIQTEISSISLVFTHYINEKSIYYYLNNIIFYTLFFKFRIYDYYYNIIRYDSYLYIAINKYTPNNYSVIQKILQNVHDNVTIKELLALTSKYIYIYTKK